MKTSLKLLFASIITLSSFTILRAQKTAIEESTVVEKEKDKPPSTENTSANEVPIIPAQNQTEKKEKAVDKKENSTPTPITPEKKKHKKISELKKLHKHIKKLIKKSRKSGLYAGAAFGFYFPNTEFLSSAAGMRLFAEWRQSNYLSANLLFATGQYSAIDNQITAVDQNGSAVNITQKTGNSLGFWKLGFGIGFHYPYKKFTPGLSITLAQNKLQGPSYSFDSWISVGTEISLWYRIWRKLEVGLLATVQSGSVSTLFFQGQSYTLNNQVSTGNFSLLIAAKYKLPFIY